jgi:dihydrodipicolinate synthase/N-acetylneuraminate lyase
MRSELRMFSGVIPMLATPFGDDDSLDLRSWQGLLDFARV